MMNVRAEIFWSNDPDMNMAMKLTAFLDGKFFVGATNCQCKRGDSLKTGMCVFYRDTAPAVGETTSYLVDGPESEV